MFILLSARTRSIEKRMAQIILGLHLPECRLSPPILSSNHPKCSLLKWASTGNTSNPSVFFFPLSRAQVFFSTSRTVEKKSKKFDARDFVTNCVWRTFSREKISRELEIGAPFFSLVLRKINVVVFFFHSPIWESVNLPYACTNLLRFLQGPTYAYMALINCPLLADNCRRNSNRFPPSIYLAIRHHMLGYRWYWWALPCCPDSCWSFDVN